MTTTAPGLAAQGERKLAVVLFADLTGYTELCRRLDPEDVAERIRPVMAALRATVDSNGGTVCTQAGDGFMAVFGVPVAVEDAAHRALDSAMQMQGVIRQANATGSGTNVPDVHIGIAAGEVLAVPSDEPAGFSLIGTTVNLASRLCDSAAAGEVLADDRCHELARNGADWADPRSVEVRGHDAPVTAWLLAATAPAERDDDLPGVPFLDRAEAIHSLDELLEEVVSLGIGRVAVVAGEPGIGKTALIRHWQEGQQALTSVWLSCGSPSSANHLTRLIDELSAAGGGRTDEDQAVLENSSTPAVVGTGLGGDNFAALQALTRRLLERLADQPVVVVIDDAHAAEPSLAALIDELRRDPIHGQVLTLLLMRNDVTETTPDITLQPLDVRHGDALLAHALGAQAPGDLQEAIRRRAAGHPLMTLQSAAYLLETGLVEVVDGACRLVSPDAAEVLPTSLRLFVAARLDQLPSAEKNLLQHLSSCGDDIQDDDLASMPETPEPERLRPLVRRRLLVEVEPRRWRFSHGVVREVAYASLPRRARRDLHRRQLVTTAAADDPGRRAFHARSWAESTSSEDAEERRTSLNFALRETRLHAESLFRMHADSAHAAIRQVTGLLDDGASAAPEEAADLLLLRSACEVEMWRFDEAVESATEAVQLCREHDLGPSRLSHALSSQGWALSRARRLNAARQAADEAFNVADSSGDLVAQANALLVTGSTWRYESLPTYIAMTEDAYNLYVRAGDTNGAGESARWLAYLLSESVPTVAEKWLKNANAATAVTDLRGQAWIARATALASAVRLDLRTAREAAARSVHLGTLLGALDIVGDGLAVLVESAAAFGDFTGMRDALERMDEQAESTDNPRLKLVAGSSAASGLLRSGQPEPAQRRKREALELAAMFGTSELEEASAGAAALARNQGAWDEALEHLSHAQRAGGRAPLDAYTLNLRAHEARVLVAAGRAPDIASLTRLRDDASSAGAVFIASYLDAVVDQARLLVGEQVPIKPALPTVSPEERAMRADNRALLAELQGVGAEAAWRDAVAAWSVIGSTIWRARAEARAGDLEAAERTLDAIGADEPARSWARQRGTGNRG